MHSWYLANAPVSIDYNDHVCTVTMRDCAQVTYARGYGTVLDSGTTFTYLPREAFREFQKQVVAAALAKGAHQVPGPDPKASPWHRGSGAGAGGCGCMIRHSHGSMLHALCAMFRSGHTLHKCISCMRAALSRSLAWQFSLHLSQGP